MQRQSGPCLSLPEDVRRSSLDEPAIRFSMSDSSLDLDQDLPADSETDSMAARRQIETGGRSLRQHTARGTMINSGFFVGLAAVGMLRRVVVAAFLTQAEFGLWGILVATLITLSWLKEVGIADKYIQQAEANQEAAYQKAFTLELGLSGVLFAVVAAAMPIYGMAYGHTEMIVPGIVLGATLPLNAFQAPIWIAYRRMQFVRQRTLAAIDPLTAFVLTVTLGILGLGYWALVIGAVGGSLAGALIASLTSPYPIRLRFDKGTLKEYTSFSWPLLGLGVSNLITVQGTLLVANRSVGLAGVGAIGLASTIASFAERVDGIVSQAIYPAVCAVADRRDLMQEAFIKSNRLTLMWAFPFGTALALFAPDLVTFVFGERWREAVPVIAGVGLIVGFAHVGFNWAIFMRAVNNTRPIFAASLFSLGVFVTITAPAVLVFGLNGYIIGFGVSVALQLIVRGYFLRRLFMGFEALRHLVRAVAPSVPAAGVVLLFRYVADGHRTLARALVELALYIGITALCTLFFERRLITEVVGYLRGTSDRPLIPSTLERPAQGA